MTKQQTITLKHKTSAETAPYSAWTNVDYSVNLQAEVYYKEDNPYKAMVLGSELLKAGVDEKSLILTGKYMIGDFEIVGESK